MKVYSIPDALPAPKPDYRNYDSAKEQARELQHMRDLKEWLLSAGFDGEMTGEIVRFPVADGYARYMLADGSKSALIHLPYGDGYQYTDAQYLPKAEIVRRIGVDRNLAALFASGAQHPAPGI